MGEAVFLVGSPAEVGELQGTLQCPVLIERWGRTLRRAEKTGQLTQLRERAQRFSECLSLAAPHWLQEAEALACSAGLESWQLAALNCLPPDFWGESYDSPPFRSVETGAAVNAYEAQGYEPLLGGDCTTFFALGAATIGGETLFHKNRDERDEVQNLYIKQVDGCNRFVGGADIGNLGTAHLHTEDYWVGANNTGSEVASEEFEDCALTDCHVLRWLAERCTGLDEILPALEELISRRLLGGGGHRRGMILLFADATRGLVVELTSRRLAHCWYQGDATVVRTNHFMLPEMQAVALPPHPGSLRRWERARALWEGQYGVLSISTCGEIARDRDGAPLAICRNSSDGLGSVTVSTSTAIVSALDERRSETHFRNCHPGYTPAVILTPLDRVSDSDLVSGAQNQHWRNYRAGA